MPPPAPKKARLSASAGGMMRHFLSEETVAANDALVRGLRCRGLWPQRTAVSKAGMAARSAAAAKAIQEADESDTIDLTQVL